MSFSENTAHRKIRIRTGLGLNKWIMFLTEPPLRNVLASLVVPQWGGLQAHQEVMCGPLSGQSVRCCCHLACHHPGTPGDIFSASDPNSCLICFSESHLRHEKHSPLLCSPKRVHFVRENGCIVRSTFWGVPCQPEWTKLHPWSGPRLDQAAGSTQHLSGFQVPFLAKGNEKHQVLCHTQ